MSVHEIFEMLTEMVRRGPDNVVAYGLGAFTVMVVFVSIHWLAKRPLRLRNERLQEENYLLQGDKATADYRLRALASDCEKLRAREQFLAGEVDELRQTQARLEVGIQIAQEEVKLLRDEQKTCFRENTELREARARLEAKLENACEERDALRKVRETLAVENDDLRQCNAKIEAALSNAQTEKEDLDDRLTAVAHERNAARENETELVRQVAELSEQVQRLADFDGRVWERPPTAVVPEFRPLVRRQVPIIALANLKGGVGKTTLTANLGAILAKQNHRVLLLDLDYQGSLTSLCLDGAEIHEIRRRRLFVDRLLGSRSPQFELFEQCSHRIEQLPDARLIAADEPLADEENRLMAQWLLEPDEHDVRFVLRSYLHSEAVRREYDYVLIDCPPRLTTACVGAIAAADFLLIPVLLDRTSTEAVPRQLRSLRKLKRAICPRLAVLGLVANRTHPRAQLISRESQVWESLAEPCEDCWGEPVYRFSSVIRQNAAFAEAARANSFAALYREMQPSFLDFANELRARIAEHEREGSPAVSPQPQAAP